MTNTTTDTKAIKDVLENVLIVYEVPETCLENVMMFIEGVKVGAKSKERDQSMLKCDMKQAYI